MKKLLSLIPLFILATTSGATGECCLLVQEMLNEVFAENDTSGKISHPGTLLALLSPENTTGFKQLDFNLKGGKNQTVQVRYTGSPASAVVDELPDFCAPGDTDSELFATVALTNYRGVQMTLSLEEFREFCSGVGEFRQEMTIKYLNQLYRAINNDVAALLVGSVGDFAGATAGPLEVPLVRPSGILNEHGIYLMTASFQDIEVMEKPILIGSGMLNQYVIKQGLACCNSLGFDHSNEWGFSFYRDNSVGAAFGDPNQFVGLAPGAAQFIYGNRNLGDFQINIPTQTKTTIIDPRSGLVLDMDVNYIACDSTYVITWGLKFGLATLPDDLVSSGTFDGVNNILHFEGVCGDESVCS